MECSHFLLFNHSIHRVGDFHARQWTVDSFITQYIGVPIFFVVYLKRAPVVAAKDIDIWTGNAVIDNEVWPEQCPRKNLEKGWSWLC